MERLHPAGRQYLYDASTGLLHWGPRPRDVPYPRGAALEDGAPGMGIFIGVGISAIMWAVLGFVGGALFTAIVAFLK